MYGRIKKRCHEILEAGKPGDLSSKIFDFSILTLILLNIIAVILETVEHIRLPYKDAFNLFELVSVVIFSIEYILRIWSCTSDKRYSAPIVGRIRCALSLVVLIDLLAILPFYLPMLIPIDLRFLRILRLFRLLRLFKLGRYTQAMKIVGRVLMNTREELLVTAFVVFMLLVMASSLMYYVEHDAQPTVFSSIPAAMWWGVATLTTVGYGDMCPITAMGKLLGSAIALLGIGMFALPAGILGSGFLEEIQLRHRKKKLVCPKCGTAIDTRQSGSHAI